MKSIRTLLSGQPVLPVSSPHFYRTSSFAYDCTVQRLVKPTTNLEAC